MRSALPSASSSRLQTLGRSSHPPAEGPCIRSLPHSEQVGRAASRSAGTACGGGGEGEAGGTKEPPSPRAVFPPPALAPHSLRSVPLSERPCSLGAGAAQSRLPPLRALRLWRPP
ncbi:unnamed protein product [Coccothraustes coccothraustes]